MYEQQLEDVMEIIDKCDHVDDQINIGINILIDAMAKVSKEKLNIVYEESIIEVARIERTTLN